MSLPTGAESSAGNAFAGHLRRSGIDTSHRAILYLEDVSVSF